MIVENILEAENEAKRFLKRVNEVRESQCLDPNENTHTYMGGSKETGALKRASMDLTRALSKMRNVTY